MREIVSPLSGIRSPFGQRREVSLLALYAANGLNPSLVIDAKTPRYFLDGVQSDLVSVTDHSRASSATYLDSTGTLQTAASGVLRDNAYAYVDGVLTGPYVLTEPDAVNLLHSTDALVIQTEEVTAQPYTLQFTGTGIVTLLGAYSGSLVGTGAGEVNRVYLTFTPTAGTLTITVSGTVTDAQLEAGSIPTSYIPNLAGSGSAARAEDVLTIPDAPWPEAVTTGPELVTNGTFDTDTSGWTEVGGTLSLVSNKMRLTSSSGTAYSRLDSFGVTSGSVYKVSFDVSNITVSQVQLWVGSGYNLANWLIKSGITSTQTVEAYFVAQGAVAYFEFVINATTGQYADFDNISVREISPRAIGISMKGLMTGENSTFADWTLDANNGIQIASGASDFTFTQEAAGVVDSVTGGSYASGINVPFSIASYHKDNGINGAVDGVALTEDTTPTILPDLSATPIQIRPGGGPLYLEEMRIWVESAVDKITDALIEEASA